MSVAELKRWEIRCDRCSAVVIVESRTEPDLPDGWTMRELRVSGTSGFYQWSDLCEACAAELTGEPITKVS